MEGQTSVLRINVRDLTNEREYVILEDRAYDDQDICFMLTRIFFGQEDRRLARSLYQIARLGRDIEEAKRNGYNRTEEEDPEQDSG